MSWQYEGFERYWYLTKDRGWNPARQVPVTAYTVEGGGGHWIKGSPHTCSSDEKECSLNGAQNCFSLEQEVEFLIPVSNGCLYRHSVGENAQRQDGGDKAQSVSILKLIKLHDLLCFSAQR